MYVHSFGLMARGSRSVLGCHQSFSLGPWWAVLRRGGGGACFVLYPYGDPVMVFPPPVSLLGEIGSSLTASWWWFKFWVVV